MERMFSKLADAMAIRNFEIPRQGNSDEQPFNGFASGDVRARTSGQTLNLNEQTREETIRLVRQVFFSGRSKPQVVVFSGVEYGSGCTWVCARTADMLAAHVDGWVCLVDADLRSPSLRRHFEIETSSIIVNEEFLSAPVRQTAGRPGGPNLWLLSLSAERADSQSFERLRSRVPELRNEFSYILIDAPPINSHADAALLGGVADGLVMILGANDTRRDAAVRAKETLQAGGIPLLGAVLNKRTFPIPEKLYRKL